MRGGFLRCAVQLFHFSVFLDFQMFFASCFFFFFFKRRGVVSVPLRLHPVVTLDMARGDPRSVSTGKCLLEIPARPPGRGRWRLEQRSVDKANS